MPEDPKREVTTERGKIEDNHKTKETEVRSVLSIRNLRSQQWLNLLHHGRGIAVPFPTVQRNKTVSQIVDVYGAFGTERIQTISLPNRLRFDLQEHLDQSKQLVESGGMFRNMKIRSFLLEEGPMRNAWPSCLQDGMANILRCGRKGVVCLGGVHV
jgi:hypothetical protein